MDFTVLFIIVLVVIGIVFIAGMWLFLRRLKDFRTSSADDKSAMMLQQQMQELTRTMQQQQQASSKQLQDQHIEVSRIARDTVEKLTKVEEATKQVGKFSEQLQDLQDILKNPKQRGILGEYYLEETLSNVLPPKSYQMQYQFKNGDIVDAIVRVKNKIVPIDSKFSLENYQRLLAEKDEKQRVVIERNFKQDLKNRIDETAKYVRPEEGTMDFAFMFIPSESIYYDLLVSKVGAVKVSSRDLIEYAFRDKKVIIVSPTSFLAYLQTVLQGLRAMQIEESAKEIRANVEKLNRHLQTYHQYHLKLGTQLGTVVNTYNTSRNELRKVDKDVTKITGDDRELLESGDIEKPQSE